MDKILAGILTFLLWIMPWCNGLYGLRERVTFDRNVVMNEISIQVQTRNVANLESMMRPWFKNNVPDLTDKINDFYNAIDGNITSIEKGVEESMNTGGVYSERLSFYVTMDDQTYYNLVIWYDVSNTENPSEVGISVISLSKGKTVDPDYTIHFSLKAPDRN